MPDRVVGVQYKVDYNDVVKADKAVTRHQKALDAWRKAAVQTTAATKQATTTTKQATTTVHSSSQAWLHYANSVYDVSAAYEHYITRAERASTVNEQLAQQSQSNAAALRREVEARFRAIQVLAAQRQAQIQAAQAQAAATQTTKLNTGAWLKNIKRMVLWGVGAASVYRLFMKLRRVMTETVETLFENTEEYRRLKAAQDRLKVSLVAAAGTGEEWLELLDFLASRLNTLADATIKAGAAFNTFYQLVTDPVELTKTAWQLLSGEIDLQTYLLDEYNRRLAESANLESRWAKATLDSAGKAELKAEALERTADAQKEAEDAAKRYHSYLEKVQAAEQDRIDAIIDLYTEYARKLDDIAEAARRAFEDAAIKGARRREDIERAYARKLEDIEAASRDKRASAEAAYRIKLIQIEMRYRERLIRIEETYRDSFEDAVARRDALALVRARRKRTRDTAAATRQYQNDKVLARLNYEKQLQDQRRNLERMREDARRARDRALEDLRRSLERERADILLSQQRKEEDARLARDRERRDIEDHYTRAIARANTWYTTDETNYGAHLNRKIAQLQNYYRQVVALYNTYAGQLARPLPLGATGRGTYRGGGPVPFAEGGVGLFTSPTTIQVAEGGAPELVIVQPMTAGAAGMSFSGNMRHQVSGSIDAMMAGWEGRMSVAITQAVQGAVRDVLRA